MTSSSMTSPPKQRIPSFKLHDRSSAKITANLRKGPKRRVFVHTHPSVLSYDYSFYLFAM